MQNRQTEIKQYNLYKYQWTEKLLWTQHVRNRHWESRTSMGLWHRKILRSLRFNMISNSTTPYQWEYPHKIWPYMVQYLHFRILEFPLTISSSHKNNFSVPQVLWVAFDIQASPLWMLPTSNAETLSHLGVISKLFKTLLNQLSCLLISLLRTSWAQQAPV